MCLKIYQLDSAHFITAAGLVWQAALNIAQKKLDILTDISMLLMIEKGIRQGICHAIHRYSKSKNKYRKNHDKNKESSYLKH